MYAGDSGGLTYIPKTLVPSGHLKGTLDLVNFVDTFFFGVRAVFTPLRVVFVGLETWHAKTVKGFWYWSLHSRDVMLLC